MLKGLARVDDKLLEVVDAFILWLWNQFGVPWRSFIRATCFGWLGVQFVTGFLEDGRVTLAFILLAIFALTIWALNEWTMGRLPEDRLKAVIASNRAGRWSRVWRLVMWAWFAMDVTESLLLHLPWLRPIATAATLWLYYASCAVPPIGPRKPRRSTKLVLARAG